MNKLASKIPFFSRQSFVYEKTNVIILKLTSQLTVQRRCCFVSFQHRYKRNCHVVQPLPHFKAFTVPNFRRCSFSEEMAKKSAILLLANDAEEMEAVITVDVLRRAGIDVTIASITGNQIVKCSRGVNISADTILDDATKNKKYDVVILPGGLGGSQALAKSAEVGAILKAQEKDNGVIAAICAAPTVLKAHEIAYGKQITSYPSMKDQLVDKYKYIEQKVVTDGNLITSRGPATAYAFGLAIVEKLLNKEAALTVSKGLLYDDYK